MKKILVVGQTPPPYGGQAQMIEYLLKGAYEKIQKFCKGNWNLRTVKL